MTDLDTARRIAGAFAVARPVEAIAAFGTGHINATFLATTRDDDFVVQRINADVFAQPDLIAANIGVVRHHVPATMIPEPIAARDGGWLVWDGGDAWRAWVRVAQAAPVQRPTCQTAGSAARLLGRFHTSLFGADPGLVHETIPNFHDPRRRLAALRRAITDDPCGRATAAAPEIATTLASAPLADMAAELMAALPRRIAHNDAKLDNFLFVDGKAACIIDLDTVMPGAFMWDVGDLVRTASTRGAEDDPANAVVDGALYAAIVDGYRAGVGAALEPAELAAVDVAGAIVTYEQAVRFLTDWLEGDTYYKTHRPEHNLDRARAQLRLLAGLPGGAHT